MIVVLDTNVWVSAFHFGDRRGNPIRALEKATQIDTLAICDEIEKEIYRVLTARFLWSLERIREVMAELPDRVLRVQIQGTVNVCRDPNDNIFLECAALAKADLLISGDKDLLSLGVYQTTRIVTPAQYVDEPPTR